MRYFTYTKESHKTGSIAWVAIHRTTHMTIIEKLNKRYPTSPITDLANEGRLQEAADLAANYAMWGIWEELRTSIGASATPEAKNTWLRQFNIAREAKWKAGDIYPINLSHQFNIAREAKWKASKA